MAFEGKDKESYAPPSDSEGGAEPDAQASPNKLAATVSNITDPQSIKQGGRRAWLQVLGGFMAFFSIWGIPLVAGVFQSFYGLDLLRGQSEFRIAWIGTFQNFLVSMVSVLSGPIYDLGYYRTLVYTGSLMSVVGMMMLSLSSQYYQLFLSHACNGVGSGLLYVPTLALVAQSHDKTRSLAMGLVASGIALGGIVYTIIFLELQPKIGFPWTVRLMGFIALLSYVFAIPLLLGVREKPKTSGKARALTDFSAIRSPAWVAYAVAQFFSFWGYLIPFFFAPTFAQVALGAPIATGDWLLVGIQGASLIGRLCSAVAAHYFGVLLPLSISLLISGVLSLGWLGFHTLQSFTTYCVLFGFFSGALIALPPAVFPAVCPKKSVQGTWMGMAWALTSLASLTGSPIGGTLIDLQEANFRGAIIWTGVILITGASLFGVLWLILKRQKGTWRI